jgi:hypothetical protein
MKLQPVSDRGYGSVENFSVAYIVIGLNSSVTNRLAVPVASASPT